MADAFIKLPDDSANTGKKPDLTELVVGGQTVERQRVQLGGAGAAELADVKAARPAIAAAGLVTREAPRTDAWAVPHTPAVNTQASASKAAGGAGVRHVCTGLSFSIASDGTAPAAVQLTVNLRDGITGVGAVLASWVMALPAVAGEVRHFGLTGLEVVGTANAAMTLEFSAAGGIHTYESVNLFGYDCS